MMIFFDIILICLCTYFTYFAYKKVIFDKNASIANYIMLIIYVFCVFPIILNYFIGMPTYQVIYWYKPFLEGMTNYKVSIIYDCWISASMFLLYFYSKKYNKNSIKEPNKNSDRIYKKIIDNNFFSKLLIFLPFILIVLSGNILNYTSFHNTTSARGMYVGIFGRLIVPSILLSLFVFFAKYYNEKLTFKKFWLSILYFFLIVWISGKRFILANIMLMLFFYITKSDMELKNRKKLFKYVPLLAIFLIIFSGFYLKFIRPLSDTSSNSIYEMLRVDFGRDDVIKYVINEEIINNEMILDYRFESFISLFLFFVPRMIWPTKPYPHYNYLTSSILNLPISELPSGTTPSWYEMCLANLGIFGILFSCIALVYLCKIADNEKNRDIKMLYLILIVVLLTQSMDAYIVYIAILFLIKVSEKINEWRKKKKIIENKICNKKDCTGCSACSIVCPQKCIEMSEDKEHFLYPNVNSEKCVNCNLCKKVCPSLNKTNIETKLGFSAQIRDKKVLDLCASGGAFAGIAMEILEKKGIVYGVGYDEKEKLTFIRIDKKEELYKILNSKYYQCYINSNILKSLINDSKDKKVLFSGTPCQISAIKNIKTIEHDNLYTFEILCQGVQNDFVVKKYNNVLEKKENSNIDCHIFRSKKKYIGRNYLNEYKFGNGKTKFFVGEEDPLSLSFQRQIFLRNSCYNCKYTNNKRVADFTGGDIWKDKYCSKEMNFKKGISILLCNSSKACELITNQTKLYLMNIDYDEALKENVPYHHSVKKPISRIFSFKLLKLNMNPYIVTKICCFKYYIKKIVRGVK